MSYAVELVNWGDIVAMIRRIPVFQQGAVCLTNSLIPSMLIHKAID